MKKINYYSLFFLVLLLTIPLQVIAATKVATSHAKVAIEVTALFRSARKVISDYQNHINDPDIANKGLTDQLVINKVIKEYKKVTGQRLYLNDLSPEQNAMTVSIKEVLFENQDLINKKGIAFKGFLPAIFARQLANKFNQKMLNKVIIKLTAPKKYVRNKANSPDYWEHKIIEKYLKKSNYTKGALYHENTKFRGKKVSRFLLPEYYQQSCLACHGSPKGEIDITGGKKEGGVLNELGGVISLIIYK